ncbi:hypothetical protein [Azospirillum oleiclasticum]|uniref:hypothetical protein n=1 Tax=Azospirillum oleiclasticum TaxID=2735135 RepID=UPI0015D4A168|nr:hypothetical protein [Azospirillum oleiclasticum]
MATTTMEEPLVWTREAVAGAMAGCAATGPMTIAMSRLYHSLPEADRHALPPRLLTERILAPDGSARALPAGVRADITLLAHYGYGALTGALYPAAARRLGLTPVLGGAAYGVAVWAASYLGWIPAVGLLTPATRHSARRNGLMIAAHVVWGAATGLAYDRLRVRPDAFTAAVPRDAPEIPRRDSRALRWGLAALVAGAALAWSRPAAGRRGTALTAGAGCRGADAAPM